MTGAGGGIGSGIARRLTAPDGAARVVAAAVQSHGRLDGLVNNAEGSRSRASAPSSAPGYANLTTAGDNPHQANEPRNEVTVRGR